jgi:hypothetical protein
MNISRMVLMAGAALLAVACNNAADSGNETTLNASANSEGSAKGERRSDEEATRRFVNSRDLAINDRLRERYIDFSFDYPRSWRSIEQGPAERESNFAQIRAPQRNGSDTINVSFGTAGFNNIENASPEEFEQLIENLGRDMGRSWRNYRLVSHGRQRLGSHDSWGWRFTTEVPNPEGGDPIRVRGRADIYLPEGQSHGLYIITLVTENSEDFPDVEEVGQTGELRRIFDSLSFGRGGEGERRSRNDDSPSTDDADLEPR